MWIPTATASPHRTSTSIAALLCMVGVACSTGCSKKEKTAEEAAGFRVANVAAATVEESVTSGDVTYARVKEAQWEFWIRTDDVALSKGDHVLMGKGPLLENHRDKALDRSFKRVIDIDQIKVVSAAESKRFIALPTPKEDHGIAIGDAFAKRSDLDGKPVVIRGRIVKANKGIFDTNWYHLRDGTGGEGTNDLTVTSDDDANVGDVVVARGDLTADHSLGFGYDYDAIVLDGAITVEDASGTKTESDDAIPRELISEMGEGDPAEAMKRAKSAAESTANPRQKQEIKDWVAERAKLLEGTATRSEPLDDLGVYGLELGASDDAAITAWLDSAGIACAGAASERRSSFVYDCGDDLTGKEPEGVDAGKGKLTRLMLGHADDAPLGFIALTHHYSLPPDALAAYDARVEAVSERLGDPTSAKPVDEEAWAEAKVGRFKTEWRYPNATVSVVLFRLNSNIRVTERWDLASDAQRFAQRPGAKPIHGAIKRTPNPHILMDES